MKPTKEELRKLVVKLNSNEDVKRLKNLLILIDEPIYKSSNKVGFLEENLGEGYTTGGWSTINSVWNLSKRPGISLDEFEKLALQTLLPEQVHLKITTTEEAKQVVDILQKVKEPIYSESIVLQFSAFNNPFCKTGTGLWQYGDAMSDKGRKLVTIDQLRTILGAEKEEELPRLPITSYQVLIKTDQEAVRMRDVLNYNRQPMADYTMLPEGKGGNLNVGVKKGSGVYEGLWIYLNCLDPDYVTVTLDEFEAMFGEKSQSTTKQPKDKTMKITRQALGEIYNNVCTSWQSKIDILLRGKNFENEFEVPESLVLEAWKEAYKTIQKEWLAKYLPKPEPKYKVGEWYTITNGQKFKDDSITKKLLEFRPSNDPFSLVFEKGGSSFWKDDPALIRLATPEEIKEATTPKFKVGDWVLTKQNADGWGWADTEIGTKVLQVKEVKNNPYGETKRYLVVFDKQDKIGRYMYTSADKIERLATPAEIEQAQWYPDGTPCLVRMFDDNTTGWELRYANGLGAFYEWGKKSGVANKAWKHHQKLDTNNLPVNS